MDYVRVSIEISNPHHTITEVYAILSEHAQMNEAEIQSYIENNKTEENGIVRLIRGSALRDVIGDDRHWHMLGYGRYVYTSLQDGGTYEPVRPGIPYYTYIYTVDNGVQSVKIHNMHASVKMHEHPLEAINCTAMDGEVVGTVMVRRESQLRFVVCVTGSEERPIGINEFKYLDDTFDVGVGVSMMGINDVDAMKVIPNMTHAIEMTSSFPTVVTIASLAADVLLRVYVLTYEPGSRESCVVVKNVTRT